jgi:hypothetical protein
LTISIKTQNNNKIKVSCSANQQNVTLHDMTINTVGTLNLSTQFCALFGFFAFIETLEFFFQEIRPPFSMLNAKRFEIVYVHHVYKRLKHDLFHISPGIIPRRWPPYQHETQSRVYMGRGMIAGMIWKMSCINLFIIYIR